MILLAFLLSAPAQDELGLPVSGTTRMLLIAEEWEASKDWEKAERQYRRLLRQDPSSVDAALGLARVLEKQKKFPSAIEAYRSRILDYEPEAVEALARLLEESEPEEAAALYRKTRQLNHGKNPSPWMLAEARCLCRASKPEESIAALEAFLKKVRSPAGAGEVLLCLAVLHYDAGDEDTAAERLRRVVREDSEHPETLDPVIVDEARARLERIQVVAAARRMSQGGGRGLTEEERIRVDAALDSARTGRLEEATRSLRLLVADAPRATEAWGALGDVLFADDNISGAERAYVAAVVLSPEDPRWRARLGLLLADAYGGRRHSEAAQELQRALELRPSWGEIRFRLAEVQVGLRQFEEAKASLEIYIEAGVNGEHDEAVGMLAALQREMPSTEPLTDDPEVASEVAPEVFERFQVTKVYWNRGEVDAARSELELLLAEAPDWYRAHNLRAMMAESSQDAIAAWEDSLALREDQPQIQTSLGEELRQQGETARGLALLEEAAEGGSAEAHYLLAEVAFEGGDLDTARKQLGDFFLSAYGGPFYEPAQALRDELERRSRQKRLASAVSLSLVGFAGLLWWLRRRQARTLDDLLIAAPECAHDLARLLSAIRHEVLKHNTTLLEEMAHAWNNGDYAAVRWAAERLFGDGESEGVIERYIIYRAGIERLGRKHGVRLDLRSDPVFGPMSRAMKRLSALKPRLLRPERDRDLEGPLLALSEALNEDAYRALGRLIQTMGTVLIDESVLRAVDGRVRDEPGVADQELPELRIEGEALPARVFRGDLDDIVANLLRNAYLALIEGADPSQRRIALLLEEDDDPITGLELVVLRFCDSAPGKLTNAMIQSRSIGGGLGLAVDLITRHNGSITVEDEPGWSKAVVVCLPRAEGDEDEPVMVWVSEED